MALATVVVAITGLSVAATTLHLEIPAPDGPHAVGRMQMTWVDRDRPEAHTAEPSDRRAVPIQVWFPAEPGTGRQGGYVPDLPEIAGGLVTSGELNRLQVWGLQHVRHHAHDGATISAAAESYPVVVLSPGNATNVAFYATLAEELASRGYVVVGVDHPYQVAAVALPEGEVATYDASRDSATTADDGVRAKIDERVADIAFVLDELAADRSVLEGRMDLTRVAVVGHSNGGLAAAELCRTSSVVLACANLDGQAAGGPFSVDPAGGAPEQPFLFLTKETALHPELHQRFESAGDGAYRVVIPAAAHDEFADGALFRPTLNPWVRRVDRVAAVHRGFVAAFLDIHLNNAPRRVLDDVTAGTDVYVNVYPLGDRPPLPAADRAAGR